MDSNKFASDIIKLRKAGLTHSEIALKTGTYKGKVRNILAVNGISGRRDNSFTIQDDEILLNEIKNFPTNLQHAFRIASEKLTDKSIEACQKRWYGCLRKKEAVISCGSKEGFSSNVKNTKRLEDGALPEQNLKHYLVILKELLNLPQKERDAIVALLSMA